LAFEEAIKGEAALHSRNLVPTNYSGEWICPECGSTLYDSGWYCASEKAIAYYLDPRNFLDETNVFQFQDLNGYIDGVCTLEGIQSQIKGTYLQGYASVIDAACKNQEVNSYYIVTRMIQEQEREGTSIGKGMDGGDGYKYYNPFNIGASGNGWDEIYSKALAAAKQYGWNTMQKAIEGGIKFCKKDWLENYQNTLYQNKFDLYIVFQ
jgi:beta-N-acetylglucosaminidase